MLNSVIKPLESVKYMKAHIISNSVYSNVTQIYIMGIL